MLRPLLNISRTDWQNLASMLSLAVALVVLPVLVILRGPAAKAIALLQRTWHRTADTPLVWFLLLPAFSLMLNVGVTVYHGRIPVPIIHDEFSYLLAGDTFAHGRLTNPTPPFFEHFETPQELMRPTRMSKYPPGQGLFLALGEVLTGLPIVGVWISTAAACTAIYWMMLGFVSRPWALVGGWLAVLGPALLDWSQVYWGGCVAVLGGALLIGGWGRLMLHTRAGDALWMWVGIAILANSRPFEGFTVTVPLLVALLVHLRRRLATVIVTGAITLVIAGGWMLYYNFRVTGDPLRMPIMEYARQYDVYPKFWFEPLRPTPEYHNRSQRWVHTDFERGQYDQLRTLRGFVSVAVLRIGALAYDNLRLAVLYIAAGVALLGFRDRRIRWLLIAVLCVLIGLWLENFDLPHYSAPVDAALLLLAVVGLSMVWRWRGTSAVRGTFVAVALLMGWAAGAGMCAVEGVSADSMIVEQYRLVEMERPLQTGRHLIFVNYGPMTELTSGFANEYVYNPADLSDSRIIWARYFGPNADRPVAEHFGGRKVWMLEVGKTLDLKPYLEQP